MSIIMQINPFDFFVDADGDALDAGYIWIGEANKDPRQYPVVVYYDQAATIPAALPLRTSNGYVVRNGSPTFLYVNGNYSVMVLDRRGRQIYYVPDFLMIGTGVAVTSGDLSNSTDPAKGAALVGMMGFNLYDYLRQIRVPIEAFGAKGDYNTSTLTGTDNSGPFALARDSGLKIQLKRDAKYMITQGLTVASGMDWLGDESYSSAIYPNFALPGSVMISTSLTGGAVSGVILKGFTVARIGSNAEHGVILDNINGLTADLRVISDGTALGGAFGVAPFYPRNRPSTNCNVKAVIEYGGNFGLQFGNVDGGTMEVEGSNTMREVIGLEPYVLGRFNFDQSNVSADAITLNAHGLTNGYPLLYANLGNPSIAALNRPDYWYAIVVNANTIKLSHSKEQALVGDNVSLAAFTGTHALLKCGVLRNIRVLQSRITVDDIPASGTLTGIVDVTSASGGYHEGISIDTITVIERNPTSGNHGLFIGGAHNITSNDFVSMGCKLTGVLVDAATINNVFDASGNIAPSPPITCRSENVVINNPFVREFNGVGVRLRNGNTRVKTPFASSGITGCIGLQMEANATSLGSTIEDGLASCPNGTPLSLNNVSGNNRDVGSQDIRNRAIIRVEKQSILKQITGMPNPVVNIFSQNGTVNTYSGNLRILARSTTTDASNQAFYILEIMLSNSGGVPAVSQTFSSGLTSGAAASFPSFTWSIVANQLVATPIGSTSTTATWFFYIDALGDISLT